MSSLGSLYPRMLSSSPLHLICPICCRHLAFGNVLSVTGFEWLLSSGRLSIASYSLLSESDCLDLFSDFGDNDVALSWVRRRTLGFVEARNASSCKTRITFFLCHILRTFRGRLGRCRSYWVWLSNHSWFGLSWNLCASCTYQMTLLIQVSSWVFILGL